MAGRDPHLDAARGLGILLVVCGHLLEPTFLEQGQIADGPAFRIWQVIYAFHMPFFFLLAGATDRLAGDRRAAAVAAGALTLVLTAFAFSLLACIPQLLAGRLTPGEVLVNHLCGRHLGLAPLWFLLVLALVRCVDAAARAMPGRAASGSLLAGVLAISGACAALEVGFWHLHTLLGALPFYVLGRRSGAGGLAVSGPAALCGVAGLLVLAPGNLVHIAAGHYGDLPTFLACALGGSCGALALAGRLRGAALTAAARLGRRSFALFIVNGIVLTAAPTMRAFDDAAGLLVLLGLGIPLQVALAALAEAPVHGLRRAVDAAVGLGQRRLAALASA